MRYLKRLLGLPFFLMLNIIGMLFRLCSVSYYWMKCGGEAMNYIKKDEPKMIADIYEELLRQRTNPKNENL